MRRWREMRIFSAADNARLAARFPKYAARLLRDCAAGIHATGFPRRIGLFLTNRCDFACAMCAVMDARASGGDMPFGTVERVLDEASAHQPLVDLFGGEPLLYARLADAVKLACERRVIAALTTNGLKLKEAAQAIVQAGLPVLQVSLDGWDEASQRERGGVKGSFDRVVEGIGAVQAAKGKAPFPIIRILTTITLVNYAHLDRIQAVVAELGVPYWALTNYAYVNRAAGRASLEFARDYGLNGMGPAHAIEADVYLTRDQVDGLKRSLGRVRERNRRLGLGIAYAWDVDLRAYYSAREASRGTICGLPYTRLDIHTDGRMAVCVAGKVIGQVGETPIAEAWRGRVLADYRTLYERTRPMPMCFRCCGIAQVIEFDRRPVRIPLPSSRLESAP